MLVMVDGDDNNNDDGIGVGGELLMGGVETPHGKRGAFSTVADVM